MYAFGVVFAVALSLALPILGGALAGVLIRGGPRVDGLRALATTIVTVRRAKKSAAVFVSRAKAGIDRAIQEVERAS